MELLPPSLLWLPADVWGCIMSCLCPRDVCVFSCSTSKALQIADSRRRGVLLARHWGRLQVRAARQHMRARSTFVRDTCSMAQLLSRESCQAQILETLQVWKPLQAPVLWAPSASGWRSNSPSPFWPLCMHDSATDCLLGHYLAWEAGRRRHTTISSRGHTAASILLQLHVNCIKGFKLQCF